MQRKLNEFDKDKHDIFRAITVRPELAESLITGQIEGFITSKKKRICGEVMLVAETHPGSGHLAALGKIKEVRSLEKMSFEDVQNLIGDRVELLNSLTPTDPVFVVTFEKVQRVVELPVFFGAKVWDLVMDKDDVFIYPESKYLKIRNRNEKKLKRFERIGYLMIAGGIAGGAGLIFLLWKIISKIFE